jgi:hypothetical protein
MALKLPFLPSGVPIVDPKTGIPTLAFLKWWTDFKTAIESHVTALEFDAAIAAAAAATAAAAAAATAANTAATNAATATAADARFLSISNSNVTGCTISATDAGASATITISAHTRNYADGTSVAVAGGSVTGLAYSSHYYLFYDQASLAGGAVAYQATTVGTDALTTASTGAHPNRHLVGDTPTPAALGAAIPGDTVAPPTITGIWN